MIPLSRAYKFNVEDGTRFKINQDEPIHGDKKHFELHSFRINIFLAQSLKSIFKGKGF